MHNVSWGDEYASNKDMGTLVLEQEMSRLWVFLGNAPKR
jgi:hypothetical protein